MALKSLCMDAKAIADWEAFEQEIKELRAKYANAPSPLLFRGQGDSEWTLKTTLERSGASNMSFAAYHQLICARMAPEVKTFAGVQVPEYSLTTSRATFGDRNLFFTPARFPDLHLYRYMAYLRHLAFPSPLLDWSRSPYVAAFFAFREPLEKVARRSIYVYCERPERIFKVGALGEPSIHEIGSYVETHHRHFRQRCDYTICARYDTNYEQWRFHSHQNVFEKSQVPRQDFLCKFDLPSSERDRVLRVLNDYNLNAFSLFGSEESLLETMWFREYVCREPLVP
jgi:hypothetical protein